MLVERIRATIATWATEEGWSDLPVCELERPAQEAHGDYATPFCMQAAKVVRRPPRALAEQLRERVLADPELSTLVETCGDRRSGISQLHPERQGVHPGGESDAR